MELALGCIRHFWYPALPGSTRSSWARGALATIIPSRQMRSEGERRTPDCAAKSAAAVPRGVLAAYRVPTAARPLRQRCPQRTGTRQQTNKTTTRTAVPGGTGLLVVATGRDRCNMQPGMLRAGGSAAVCARILSGMNAHTRTRTHTHTQHAHTRAQAHMHTRPHTPTLAPGHARTGAHTDARAPKQTRTWPTGWRTVGTGVPP